MERVLWTSYIDENKIKFSKFLIKIKNINKSLNASPFFFLPVPSQLLLLLLLLLFVPVILLLLPPKSSCGSLHTSFYVSLQITKFLKDLGFNSHFHPSDTQQQDSYLYSPLLLNSTSFSVRTFFIFIIIIFLNLYLCNLVCE
ncbi:hypothetical protein RIF29_24217 [Crotalaria pallida]|uniref:Uncharacterized protein n=1 Tax=Crotalaria pallida TaxID=3830 RepID=A0AAN9EK47_CROPI